MKNKSPKKPATYSPWEPVDARAGEGGSIPRRVIRFGKRLVVKGALVVSWGLVRLLGVERLTRLLLSVGWMGFHRAFGAGWMQLFTLMQFPGAAAEYSYGIFKRKPALRAAVLAAKYQLPIGAWDRTLEIIEYASRNFSPRPKQMRLFESLMDLETVVMIQTGKISLSEINASVYGRDEISTFYYADAWRFHTLLDGKKVLESVRAYCSAIGYEPEQTLYVCETMLRAYDFWNEIDELLGEVARVADENVASRDQGLFARRKAGDVALQRRLLALRAFCHLQTGNMTGAEAIFAGPDGDSPDLQFARALYHSLRNEPELSTTAVSRGLRHCRITRDNAVFVADVLHYVARAWEESQKYGPAREFYKRAYQVGGVSFWLPEPVWRYISLLTAFGEWGRSVNMLRTGLRRMWVHYQKLARVPIERRIRTGQYIPKNGAVVLGGNGVGDEILRFGLLRAMAPKGASFTYTVDARLAGLMGRSMPKLKVISPSRIHGPYKVTEEQFWADREGLPEGTDKMRVTRQVFEAIKAHGEVMLSEDLICAYFEQAGKFRGPSSPVFEPLPDQTERARAWLDTLPRGINVGISWRSGQAGLIRDVSYTRISEWGDILRTPNVNFVLLQYSNKAEDIARELEEVRNLFGVTIHVKPDLDLRDDFEGVVAMCRALDVVIAPGTTLRETAAAAGVPTWTLSTTPYLPDQWRIDQGDGHTDLIFSSMIHFTALRYGDRTGALSEVARRVQILAQAKLPAPVAAAPSSDAAIPTGPGVDEENLRAIGTNVRNLRAVN